MSNEDPGFSLLDLKLVTATQDEVAAWNSLIKIQIDPTGLYTSDSSLVNNNMTTSVGLFGTDLTDFKSECAAQPEICDVDNYVDYNGWAIGINIAHDDDQQPLTLTSTSGT